MSETIETPKKPFGNPEGSNKKQKEISRLRNVALDEGESSTERLVAAQKLLSRFRLSRDNAKVIRKTIGTFINDPNAEVQMRAAKLKKKFLSAKELKAIEKLELPNELEITAFVAEEPPTTIVAGTSASELPTSSPAITREAVDKIVRNTTGALRYDGLFDIAALSIPKQNAVIEAIVHSAGLSLSPSEIKSVIDSLERQGFGSDFPGLIDVGRRYERVTKELLDALNRRDFAGVN